MTSNSNQITICVLSFKKNKKTLCKESVKQANKENQVIEQMRNRLYQPEEEKFDEGIRK
jgi:hypothetical protein